jgi:hypothetical protein
MPQVKLLLQGTVNARGAVAVGNTKYCSQARTHLMKRTVAAGLRELR